MNKPPGKLVILSGPSGAGKSTVVQYLLENCPLPLALSVSATTRPPRPGEIDGVHYHFLSPEVFRRRRDAGEFLECREVFRCGNWYGTLRSEALGGLAAGKWVLLEIDVDGALDVLKQVPDAITIFLHAGTMQELEKRLRLRRTETETSIARRLEAARREMKLVDQYQYEVINHSATQTADTICTILRRSGD